MLLTVFGLFFFIMKEQKIYFKVKIIYFWSNGSFTLSRRYDQVEQNYKGFENYIEKEKCLLPESRSLDFYLECGHHTYDFKFELPDGLPSSYEHPWGHIRYKIIFEINKKQTHCARSLFEKSFSLANTVDLNFHYFFRQTSTVKIIKNVRWLWHNCGQVTLTLTLSQSAYVPGQQIPFGLVVQNDSSKILRDIYVYLIQQTTIQTCVNLRVVSKFKFPRHICKCSTEIVNNACLNIPPVCESFSQNLIKLNYVIMVRVDKSDHHYIHLSDDYLTVPIFIGMLFYLHFIIYWLKYIPGFLFKVQSHSSKTSSVCRVLPLNHAYLVWIIAWTNWTHKTRSNVAILTSDPTI